MIAARYREHLKAGRSLEKRYKQMKAAYIRHTKARAHIARVKLCVVCDDLFVPPKTLGAQTSFCSDVCRQLKVKSNKKKARRLARRKGAVPNGSARKRAKHYGVRYEPIKPLVVLERDGWKCRVCGCDTPKHLRGTFEDNAPELDHIIPISQSGPHLYSNMQILCRTCNILKSDMNMDEFLAEYIGVSTGYTGHLETPRLLTGNRRPLRS